jgi:hypothetical protein
MYGLDGGKVPVLKSPQWKRLACLSISIAFLSIDGMKCDTPMIWGKNSISNEIYWLLFEGQFSEVLWVFLYNRIYH